MTTRLELGLFTSVKSAQACEQIVQQIEQTISSGALTAGQRLPSERALSRQFGVSRMTVRRAMQLLEGMGLVETRSGSGSFVLEAQANPVPQTMVGDIRKRGEALIGHGR